MVIIVLTSWGVQNKLNYPCKGLRRAPVMQLAITSIIIFGKLSELNITSWLLRLIQNLPHKLLQGSESQTCSVSQHFSW